MRSDALKRLLVVFAIADTIALALLGLSFYPPFRALFPKHAIGMQTVDFLRIGCVVALLGSAIAYGLRRRLDHWIVRLHDHMRASVATDSVPLPPIRTAGLYYALGGLALIMGALTLVLAFVSHPEPGRLPFHDPSLFSLFIAEDGPVESGSVISWLMAALCAITALVVERRRFKTKLVFYGPVILFFLVCMGEESSWGQRVFHLRTPPVLHALNTQGELNFHNVGSTMAFANLFFAITVGFFVVLPRVLKRWPDWAKYLRVLNAPVLHPFAGQVYGFGLLVWIVVGLRFGTLGFSPFSLWGYYTQMDDEIFELFAASAFFAFSALDLAYRSAEARLASGRRRREAGLLVGARGKAS